MTNEARLEASKTQIHTYVGCQYSEWRIVAVRSIQKILLNLDEFYSDLGPFLETNNEERDIIHYQIRNGWFYEAVSQAEQAIEDLFSTLMNLEDLAYFAKHVIQYRASEVKKYIWDFKSDDLRYLCEQFKMPYFPLDEPWEKEEVHDMYKDAILRTQEYLAELKEFHKKYYTDYCQYKHGLSVALTQMGRPLLKNDIERYNSIMKHPQENFLQTFHQGTITEYEARNRQLPAVGTLLDGEISKHVGELHAEGNLLFFTMHGVDLNEIVRVTERACILLNTLWKTVLWKCEEKETDEFHRVAFPLESVNRILEIGFPRGKD